VEPQGQLRLVARFGSLSPEHLVLKLLAPKGEFITSPLQCFVDPHDVGQEISFFVEIRRHYPIREPAEHGHDLAADASHTGICGIEVIGKSPVAVEILERTPRSGLLGFLDPRGIVGWKGLPLEDLMLGLEIFEKLLWVERGLSHVVALLISAVAQ